MHKRCSSPALSVILPTATDFQAIRITVAALSEQTARERIELVIVAPDDCPDVIDSEVAGFARVKIVNGGTVLTSNKSRAAGIRYATAPIVALSEDHSFPDPGWAEALIAAHEGGYAAVGPVLRSGNPRSMQSWANFLLEYSPWFEGTTRSEVDDLPGHNSSYRLELLLAYGDRLDEMFEIEAVIQRDLRAAGHRMLLEPAACTSHVNFSSFFPSLKLRFNAGRSFAGYRKTGWSVGTRISYILGAPLIPVIRLARITSLIRRSKSYSWLLPRVLPHLCISLIADGLGELIGYLAGPGNAPGVLGEIEFDRGRFLNRSDRRDLNDRLLSISSARRDEGVALAG